jgi:hypothetical protein
MNFYRCLECEPNGCTIISDVRYCNFNPEPCPFYNHKIAKFERLKK